MENSPEVKKVVGLLAAPGSPLVSLKVFLFFVRFFKMFLPKFNQSVPTRNIKKINFKLT